MPVAHQLRLRSVCLGIALALALVVPTSASASDKSLKATLATWSHQIQGKARGISLSATRHHPQRMTTKARQFRLTALRAQRALSAQRPTTARGRQAKSLALAAFRSYAAVGREWALSGEARLHRNIPAATKHARLASDFAKKGNSLLVQAGKLLR
jgi:hypothetical protein